MKLADHFFLNRGDMLQLWIDGYQGRGLAVKEILDGYKSVVDWPAADFYKAWRNSNIVGITA